MDMRTSRITFILALCLPSLALASTTTNVIDQIAGLFYLIVGLTVTVSVLLMLAGIALWLSRLGTFPTYRDEAIVIMEWAVATLFTLIIVLAVVEFIQTHTATMLYILSIGIILLVLWFVASSGIFSGGHAKEEEEE
jgi:hypothetical protein